MLDDGGASLAARLMRLAQGRAERVRRLIEAGEVEVALAAEVAVEDRLGHAGRLGDVANPDRPFARCLEHTRRLVDEPLPSGALGGHDAPPLLVPK